MNILQCHSFYATNSISGENSTVRSIGHALSSKNEVETLYKSTSPLLNSQVAKLSTGLQYFKNSSDFVKYAQTFDVILVHNPIPFFSSRDLVTLAKSMPVIRVWHNYRNNCISGTQFRNGQICSNCSSGQLKSLNGILHSCYRDSRIQSTLVTIQEANLRSDRNNNLNYHIGVSNYIREHISNSHIDLNRIYSVPNYVPPLKLALTDRTRSRPDFIFIGRISREKGIYLILDSWMKLGELKKRRAKLHIVGTGPEIQNLKKRYFSESLIFHGELSIEEISVVARTCGTGLMSSLWEEPFGKVLYEYMSLGLRQIITPFGEPPNLAMKYPYSKVLKDGSIDSMTTAMEDFINAEEIDREEIIKFYERKNNYSKWRKSWCEVVERIVNSANGNP